MATRDGSAGGGSAGGGSGGGGGVIIVLRRRPVTMPIPGPGATYADLAARARRSLPTLGRWQRFLAWFRYRPATWPRARLVQR